MTLSRLVPTRTRPPAERRIETGAADHDGRDGSDRSDGRSHRPRGVASALREDAIPLLILGGFGVACLVALGLVGGVAGASLAALVLVPAVLWGARWVLGAAAMDGSNRSRNRLVSSREPTLRYWDSALHDAANSPEGYALHLYPLLLRLYEVRLAERHGISLRMQPERAAAVIGPELWPWIDPRLPRTPRAQSVARAAGVQHLPELRPASAQLLEALVARLETL